MANRFEKVLAILNGTCNFIFDSDARDPWNFLKAGFGQAQKLGYAEADPTLDVEGIDSVHKLALVLRLTHGIRPPLEKIHREGIVRIEPFDVAMAKEFGYRIKLLAIIIDHGKRVEARLHPTMIPEHHPLGQVDGVFNGIYLRGDMVGEQLFYGRGAGKEPTASAVVGDVIRGSKEYCSGQLRANFSDRISGRLGRFSRRDGHERNRHQLLSTRPGEGSSGRAVKDLRDHGRPPDQHPFRVPKRSRQLRHSARGVPDSPCTRSGCAERPMPVSVNSMWWRAVRP